MAIFVATSAVEFFVNQFNEVTTIYSPEIADQIPGSDDELTIRTYDQNKVDYINSTSVNIDLERLSQIGGFAQGDRLGEISDVRGSSFGDIIRGTDLLDEAATVYEVTVGGQQVFVQAGFIIINNPGQNDLDGGNGNDILEGRGGGDFIDGGAGSDTASYESSPQAVNVTVNNPSTAAFSASGGDATGDILFSIENLVGSRFNDTLTGASNNNILAGGRGSDTLNGMGGTDTADYSGNSFFDAGSNTIDRVVVRLGLNGANGTGAEFRLVQPDNFFAQLSVDTLINIENVIGTVGPDEIVGNELANTLDGRNGDDLLDGGLGFDVLIGNLGIDTASFTSHDRLSGQTGTIALGLNGADGVARYRDITSITSSETDVLRSIESVVGSNLAETITGNEQANVLNGRGGADVINGGGGSDKLIGGTGNDTVNGGANDDIYDFVGTSLGSDRFFDDSGIDKVLVTSFSDIISSVRTGNNLVVTLNTSSFTVVDHFAGHQIETIQAGTQIVTLATGTIGGNFAGIIAGSNKAEILDGRGGDDFLYGNGGKDELIGGEGNDLLDGGEGADTILGGAGDDILIGGLGPDQFVFAPGFGHDTIQDLHQGDRVDLSAFDLNFVSLDTNSDGILGDGEGNSGATTNIVGTDTMITFATGDSLLITGVTDLRANDFLF